MILTGKEIERRVKAGEIKIDPFDPEQLNPASYDVRLGKYVRIYVGDKLDARSDNPSSIRIITDRGVDVFPGDLFLMHTEEILCAEKLVAVVDGKSSIGRLGTTAHVTAGYIDPGFHGQITLEVVALAKPVRLYAGMRIGQLRFHELTGEVTSYQDRGNYTGEASMGPVPSKSWKQFEGR